MGRARPIVITAPDESDPQFTEQLRMLQAHAPGLGERDMPVLTDFGSDAPFEVRLIGKDGTERRRFTSPVPAETLFEIVDATPAPKTRT
nr:DUF4174 domain-containing protein [Paracoccus sp. Z118]